MTHEELERLSKAELIEIILGQRNQLQKLQATLARLQAQGVALEVRQEPLISMGETDGLREQKSEPQTQALAVKQQRDRERATRDALRHLGDVTYLARSSLAGLITRTQGVGPDGWDLQQELCQAIESLKAVEDRPDRACWQLRYRILYLAYLKRERPPEIARRLAISERQYYRELKGAIQAVAECIWCVHDELGRNLAEISL